MVLKLGTILGYLDTGILGHRDRDAETPGYSDTMKPGQYSCVSCAPPTVYVFRSSLPLFKHCVRPPLQGYWNTGTPGRWVTRTLGRWDIGTPGHRGTGTMGGVRVTTYCNRVVILLLIHNTMC